MKKLYYDEDAYDNVEIHSTECCGIEELFNLVKDTNAVLAKVADDSERRAMIIFHDAVEYGRGERLARKIRRLKLGRLLKSPVCYNPNSSNMIAMWTWVPEWDRIQRYRDKLFKKDSYQHNWYA